MIGAGEMIEAALSALRGAGLESIAVANRTPERAADLAVRFEATAHGLDELDHLLASADVVLTCIGGDRPILTRELVKEARKKRRHHPVFIIDIGVPRNAEPEVDDLNNVYLYDIDDLAEVASDNADQRRRETVRAEALVGEEQQRFDGWFSALRAVPTIKHLRSHVEEIRIREVEKTLAKLSLGESERERVEALTRSIVNKILHAPLSRLRREAEREEGMAYLETARVLFGLDGEPASSEGAKRDGGRRSEEPESP
jgi:glutamyl-tRNA reductase